MFTIVIVGKPNVGKSTIFNRLVGRKIAIVDDQPGVTRDAIESHGKLGSFIFKIIDTAGYVKNKPTPIEADAIKRMQKVVEDADLVLYVTEPKSDISLEKDFTKWLHKAGKPVIPVINKSEGKSAGENIHEVTSLGFGEPVTISAEHNLGMADLYEAIKPYYRESKEESSDHDLRISIVGRPNVGKSTLFNAIAGKNIMITSDIAGTTRDAITLSCNFEGNNFLLEDTAGLRKKTNVIEKVEKQSVVHTLRSIRFANVVILVVDATQGLEKQDLNIASQVVEEGRALVIAVNKWDLVTDQSRTKDDIKDKLEVSLGQVKNLPLIFISAKAAKNIDKLIGACFEIFRIWQAEISTGKLNSWLKSALERNPPPLSSGRRIKLRYMTQIAKKPPKFLIFANNIKNLPESYERYLINSLQDAFGLNGIPIRLSLRKSKNPYDNSNE